MLCFSLLFLLKLLGLEPIFKFEQFPNFRNKRFYVCKNIINWTYSIFIFLLLMYQPVFETVLAIKEDITQNVPNTLFYYITPIHYYIAFRYFSSQRKKRIYESRNIEFLDNGNGIAKCMPRENTLIKSVTVLSFIASIEAILTLFLTVDPKIYDNIPEWLYFFSKIVIAVSFIPGRLVLVINSHIFFFSFLQQLQKLKELERKLKVREWRENRKSSVAILCYEIIDIRYTISRLIDKTELMYISTTIIGGISVGLLIELNQWSYTNITSIIIFTLMQFVFLTVISFIDKSQDEINKIVHRRSFASKYILRKNDFCQACLNFEKKFTEMKNSRDNIFNSLEKEVITSIKDDSKNLDDKNEYKTKDLEMRQNNFELTDDSNISLKMMLDQKLYLSSQKNIKRDVPCEKLDNILVGIKEEKQSTSNDCSPEIKIRVELSEEKVSPILFNKKQLSNTSHVDLHNSSVENRRRKLVSSDTDIFTAQMSDSLEDSDEIRQNINALLNTKNGTTYLADSGCYLTTDEYVRCIYEWSTNTGSSVDWIILTNLLNENWSSFRLLGFEFTKGKALTNAIFITSTIIASGSLLGIISSILNIF